ncbi:MAG: glycine--tRNA ligase [Candidatus Pacebacteria bacterium CG_4_10_14_0_8_um_filter_43_12]|nr:MAG: glycine--tRNA ligase [Candidatus Pacebacteria bacterium CG_4_10_14_0_8_um_filter_43_12]
MSDQTVSLDQIVALSKRRGFVYPTSSIYGGLANSYDYGPAGVELLRHLKNVWWQTFVSQREDMVGIDSQIILHPQTWVASGHVDSFADPLVEDTVTHKRYRADHLIAAWLEKAENQGKLAGAVEDLSIDQMNQFIQTNNVSSPDGHPVSEPKIFNLLFETAIGSVTGEKSKVYLRGETAQGIFTNFKNILDSSRVQLPFGVGQIGKSFRNEVTTGQFVFRTLEFEQGEIEYLFDPEETNWQQLLNDWKATMWQFVTVTLGVKEENLRWRRHTDTERSHYSLDTYDLEYNFPFGWKELWGLAYRTDYDLKQHTQFSGVDLSYTNPTTGKKFIPHVIEPAVGFGRLFLMILVDAYHQDQEKNRLVMKITPKLAPYTVAVFPLVKNKPELVGQARQIFDLLKSRYTTVWDDRGNIGKRYLSQDEIGTPFCLTIDYQSLEDKTITVRHRDTAEQERIAIADLTDYLQKKLA